MSKAIETPKHEKLKIEKQDSDQGGESPSFGSISEFIPQNNIQRHRQMCSNF